MKLRVPFHFPSNPRKTTPPSQFQWRKIAELLLLLFLGGWRGILIRHFILSFPSYHHPYGSVYAIQISPCHGRNDSECFFSFIRQSVVLRHCTHFLSCIVKLLCYVKDVGILISEGAEYRNLTVLWHNHLTLLLAYQDRSLPSDPIKNARLEPYVCMGFD